MKRYLTLLTILLLFVCAARSIKAQDSSEKAAAQKAAEFWLPLWDAGKYDESYEELAADTKKRIPKKQWFVYWSGVRKPLGKLKSRKFVEIGEIKFLPGIPDQKGTIIRYESSFENKKSMVETVAMMLEKDGTWRVAYYITP